MYVDVMRFASSEKVPNVHIEIRHFTCRLFFIEESCKRTIDYLICE